MEEEIGRRDMAVVFSLLEILFKLSALAYLDSSMCDDGTIVKNSLGTFLA